MRSLRLRRALRDDSGFTIAEALASLMVVSLLTAALSYSTIAGYRSIRNVKNFQIATALGNKALEAARDLDYEALVMKTSDLAGDSRVVNSCGSLTGTHFVDPDDGGSLNCEEIVHTVAGGAITQHITTEIVGGQRFTARRYVTWVDDTTQGGTAKSYKRMVVRLDWTAGGVSDSFTASSFVTRAKRGLPAPKYTLSPQLDATAAGQGTQVVFAHEIKNLGIPDAYDVKLPLPRPGWGAAAFYKDVNGNKEYDPGIDTPLTDTNASGIVDTGNVGTGDTFSMLVVWNLQTQAQGEPLATYSLTLTSISGIDTSATKTSTLTLTVTFFNPIPLYLHNNPTPPIGDTVAQTNLSMTSATSTATTLFRYSSDLTSGTDGGGNSGRFIRKGGSGATEASSALMGSWNFQLPARGTFQGATTASIWVTANNFRCNEAISFNVFLREKQSLSDSAGSVFSSTTMNLTPVVGTEPCGYREVVIPLNISTATTIQQNRWVELKIVVAGVTTEGALFAYDTVSFPAKVTLPQVAA